MKRTTHYLLSLVIAFAVSLFHVAASADVGSHELAFKYLASSVEPMSILDNVITAQAPDAAEHASPFKVAMANEPIKQPDCLAMAPNSCKSVKNTGLGVDHYSARSLTRVSFARGLPAWGLPPAEG